MNLKGKSLFLRVWQSSLLLILSVLSVVGCGVSVSGTIESALETIEVRVSGNDTLSKSETSDAGWLMVEVENVSSEDIAVDLVADVIDGLYFQERTEQVLSSDQRQVSRAGIPMRPGETRTIYFNYGLEKNVDPGTYFIDIEVLVPAKQDSASTSLEVKVNN